MKPNPWLAAFLSDPGPIDPNGAIGVDEIGETTRWRGSLLNGGEGLRGFYGLHRPPGSLPQSGLPASIERPAFSTFGRPGRLLVRIGKPTNPQPPAWRIF